MESNAKYHDKEGQQTIIHNLCNDAIGKKLYKFGFICLNGDKSTIAHLVSISNPEKPFLPVDICQWYYSQHGYWRRFLPKKLQLRPVKVNFFFSFSFFLVFFFKKKNYRYCAFLTEVDRVAAA
jgi:hypothetical protein